MPSRAEIAQAAAAKLASADPAAARALIGFDGFVDSIIEVVDKRRSADDYDRLKTMGEFAGKIAAAAGESANIELMITQQKLGGNGPIMANALAALGLPVTYVGNLGYPDVHPVFAEMTARAEVISIAEAAATDALEFHDGKLMLGKHAPVKDVSWENIVGRVGREKLVSRVNDAAVIGMVNWTMLPHMSEIWRRLAVEVLPQVAVRPRMVFIDLADPEKRPVEDLTSALNLLSGFPGHVNVVLGLNLKEAVQVAGALGLPAEKDAEAGMEKMAREIRAKLNLHTVVIHPRKGAAAATAGESAAFAGPFVQHPKISTGAGDHFNAGFVAARLLGLSLAESLAAGTATSGYYVRNAASPTQGQLAGFLRELPAPQA